MEAAHKTSLAKGKLGFAKNDAETIRQRMYRLKKSGAPDMQIMEAMRNAYLRLRGVE